MIFKHYILIFFLGYLSICLGFYPEKQMCFLVAKLFPVN